MRRILSSTYSMARPTAFGCVCPDCGSPLSVRIWLRLGECWNCGTRVELSLEELAGDAKEAGVLPAASPSTAPFSQGDAQGDAAVELDFHHPAPAGPVPEWWRDLPQSPGEDWSEEDTLLVTAIPLHRQALREVPAWLASLLFHLLVALVLALLSWRPSDDQATITLALELGQENWRGDRSALITPDDAAYDLPAPMDELPTVRDPEQEMRAADELARSLRMDPLAIDPHLPTLADLQARVRATDPFRRTLSYRDPRIRAVVIRQEGGTTLTEAAVARGLAWLARIQNEDGSWGLNGYSHRGAGTSLALLPFLGAGQTHLTGSYRPTVDAGIRFLLDRQRPNGDLRMDSREEFGMYVHGQAAIVLCECYAMTLDERLRDPAQRAIDFIVNAQHLRGGWRYNPGQEGDTSVFGWQLMALQSARSANLAVPQSCLDLAEQYLTMAESSHGARYAYQPEEEDTDTMTAEGLLCRIYLGWDRQHPALRRGLRELAANHPPSEEDPDYYYWYYATQAMHHYGGTFWDRWNIAMRQVLVHRQVPAGKYAGSWPDEGPFAHIGGRIYTTSLAICTLEVYYRHAPIFRRLEIPTETGTSR